MFLFWFCVTNDKNTGKGKLFHKNFTDMYPVVDNNTLDD